MDGPAIFDGCTNCQVAVACQQFQAKSCAQIEFGLYCATQPSLSGCTGITIGCWAGAYPGLSAHFAAANLDPKANNWNKVRAWVGPRGPRSPCTWVGCRCRAVHARRGRAGSAGERLRS